MGFLRGKGRLLLGEESEKTLEEERRKARGWLFGCLSGFAPRVLEQAALDPALGGIKWFLRSLLQIFGPESLVEIHMCFCLDADLTGATTSRGDEQEATHLRHRGDAIHTA